MEKKKKGLISYFGFYFADVKVNEKVPQFIENGWQYG